MKKIALGLAIAFLSATGIGSATMAITQSSAHQSAALSVSNDHASASLSANPDIKGSDVTDLVGSLPFVSDIAKQVPMADKVSAIVDGLPNLPSVNDLTKQVTSVIPSACSAGLPSLPLPSGTIGSVTSAAAALAAQAKSVVSVVPVQLPATPDVLGTAGHELGCLGSSSASPVPSICSIGAGLPIPAAASSALSSIPAPLSGILSSVMGDLGNVTKHAVTAGAGKSIGVNCSTSTAGLPDPVATVTGAVGTVQAIANKLPVPLPINVPKVASPQIPDVTGIVTGALNNPTGAVSGAVSTVTNLAGTLPLPTAGLGDVTGIVNGLIPGLPGLSCHAAGSASSGGILGSLLGSLTASVSGSC
jgi:hypothetical protein